MTRDKNRIEESDLHAYADSRLDEARKRAVEQYLAENPQDAAKVAEFQRQNEALRALYGHVADEPVPDRLDVRAIASARPRGASRWQMAAAAVVLIALGGTAGWLGRGLAGAPDRQYASFVDQAITAHAVYAVEVRHPVEVGADQEQHLVAWLSKRLDRPLTPPDLTSRGFRLVGGRLLPAGKGPAAQFMYEDGSGQRVTLFLTRNSSVKLAAFRFAEAEGLNAFYWLDSGTSYALVGNVSRDALQALATRVYEQLT